MKPYVPHTTPKINENDRVERKVSLDEKILKDIEEMIKNAPVGGLVPTKRTLDPISQLSRKR